MKFDIFLLQGYSSWQGCLASHFFLNWYKGYLFYYNKSCYIIHVWNVIITTRDAWNKATKFWNLTTCHSTGFLFETELKATLRIVCKVELRQKVHFPLGPWVFHYRNGWGGRVRVLINLLSCQKRNCKKHLELQK